VPQIFVDGRHLSKGYDELRAELADKWENGRLIT
jgi:hypothetical protein